MSDRDFQRAYQELERRMKDLAEKDGDVYVPNPEPSGLADYVFICMEPSLGGWAKDKAEAEQKVKNGFRNFLNGYDPMILHFSIRRFLCKSDQRYHMTDISKGAMLVKLASNARSARYKRWYPLLKEEIDLLATDKAQLFAVGRTVEAYLNTMPFQRHVTCLLHYSPNANRKSGLAGHEDAFNEFKKTVSHQDVLAVAHDIIEKSQVPDGIRKFVLKSLEAGVGLSNSRLRLMFNYKLAFEAFQRRADLGQCTTGRLY
jgi:hypothetical protein